MSPRTAAARVIPARTSAARTTADRAAGRATPAPRPELRVVPSVPVRRVPVRAAGAGRRAPFPLLVAGLLVVTALALLVLHIVTGVDSIEAGDLRRANASAAQEVQRLERQVVANGTPAALALAATAAGLVPAGSAAYLVIAPDGSSTVRGTVHPAPEPAPAERVPAEKD